MQEDLVAEKEMVEVKAETPERNRFKERFFKEFKESFVNNTQLDTFFQYAQDIENILKDISEEKEDLNDDAMNIAYGEVTELWRKFAGADGVYKDMMYRLVLNKEQFNIMKTHLEKYADYTVENIFMGEKLYTEFFSKVKDTAFINPEGNDFYINMGNLVAFYHFAGQIKIKGFSKNFLRMRDLFVSIGNIDPQHTWMKGLSEELGEAIQKLFTEPMERMIKEKVDAARAEEVNSVTLEPEQKSIEG